MKLKSILIAATLATFSTSGVFAADDAMKTETPKAEAKKEVNKPTKKHSHAAEKSGMPAPESKAGKSHRETMDKDMPMHDHTQDKH